MRSTRCAFLCGFVSGLTLLYIMQHSNLISSPNSLPNVPLATCPLNPDGDRQLVETNGRRDQKILCWISTTPKFKNRARLIKETWGRRCDRLLFMSPEADFDLPTVDLPVPDGRPALWGKSTQAWIYIYRHHLKDFDWFYKADDDTYAIVENLRNYLSTLDSSLPLYLGFNFKSDHMTNGFLSGGAGYVLTRESIRRFVEIGMNSAAPLCNTNVEGADDWNVGLCMHKLNVTNFDTRDSDGRLRFMPWKLDNHLIGNETQTPVHLSHYSYPSGMNCCSPTAISFHYVRDAQPLVYEYLLYGLQANLRTNGQDSQSNLPSP